MANGRRMNRATKILAAVVPIGMALAPSVVLADTHSSAATFDSQYQQNAISEAQLLQNAKSLTVSKVETLSLSYRVQVLNYRISQLYAQEQKLAQEVATEPASSSGTGDEDDLKKATAERDRLLAQLKTLWHQTFGINIQFELNANPGSGNKQEGPTLSWNTRGHQNVTVHLQNLLSVRNQDLAQWLSSMGMKVAPGQSGDHGRGRGHSKHDDGSNLQQTVNQVSDIIEQIAKVDSTISVDNARHKGSDDDGHRKQENRLVAQLDAVQRQILKLQAEAIADLQKWIQIGSGNGSTGGGGTSGTIAGVAVTASTSTVLEGSHLSYIAQLENAEHQPLKIPGIKIDFSIVGGNNDGSISTASAVTNSDGQAVVDAIAGGGVGSLQVAAQVDGTTLPVVAGPVVSVVDNSTSVTKLIAAGSAFPTGLTLGQTTGTGTVIYPETLQGAVVSGDTLQVTTSNPSVLALPSPNSSTTNVETLPAGQYALPALAAKGTGNAVVTVTDLTAAQHPSVSYTVTVTAGDPVAVEVVNPDGSMNASYSVSAGTNGPFQIAVVNSAGAEVPAPSNIVLTAAEVNQIIGAGTAVRPANGNNDVPSVMLLAGQSSVTVYADNATAGTTHPAALSLVNLTPTIVSSEVKDSRTVELTFNVGLKSVIPAIGDFWIDWGSGRGTPESIAVSGNTVTLTLWGTPIGHGSTVSLAYNPLSTDANLLTSIYGQKVAAVTSLSVSNRL